MRVLSAALLLAFPATARAAWEVGAAPATRKVRPDLEVPAEVTVALGAARNEAEGFQVLVRSSDGLTSVDATATEFTGPDGATRPAAALTLYREHYLDITQPSPNFLGTLEGDPRDPGRYPDPLIPFEDPYAEGERAVGAPFDVPAGETWAIFADLYVPADTAPGTYSGSLTVTAAGQEPVDIALTLTVWPFTLPADKTVATSFGFSDNLVRRYHGGPDEEPTLDMDEVVDRYLEVLHTHRLDRTNVAGGVDFTFDEHGALEPVDWSAYDAAVAPYLDGSRFADGAPVTRFNVGHFRPGGGTGGLTDAQWGAAAQAFSEHLDARGWWERAYVYSTDEPYYNGGDPTYEQIHADVQRLHTYAPLWDGHVLVTSPYNAIVDGDIDIWCPVTPMYDAWFFGPLYEGREFYEERRAMGEELWFYVCNANFPPYAGYDIDTTIGFEPRMVKWGAWYEGATGFLYWRVNYWVDDDPWNVWANFEYFGDMFGRNGDGFLLYPGDHDGTAGGLGSPASVAIDGPIPSYRLVQVRDGLEDWELFLLAEELGAGDYARVQVERAYRQFGTAPREDCDDELAYCPEDPPWTHDEAVLLDARWNVAAKVAFLTDPEHWPDPEAAGDTADTGQAEPEGCGCGGAGGATWLLGVLAAVGVRRRRGALTDHAS
ncbi:MAG: glycoside hydrolase domain-containing protein [Pseudomonadota bacterium]